MESSLMQLNHYQDNQTTIQLQSPQPTTSNGRPVIQLQKNLIRTDSNNRLQSQSQQQQQPQHQSQPIFSQPQTSTNFGSNSISGTTYHVSAQPNLTPSVQQPPPLPQLPNNLQLAAQQGQNPYQFKCSLLEYHMHEAILINKALRSELQEYKEKIAFEKKLRTVLLDRVKSFTS